VQKTKHYRLYRPYYLPTRKVTISNIPDIQDVNKLIELLGDMGVELNRISRDTCTFEAKDIDQDFFSLKHLNQKAAVYAALS
jgi:UDP-N-acetylglucosamine 1-carboxyvinyltransferase